VTVLLESLDLTALLEYFKFENSVHKIPNRGLVETPITPLDPPLDISGFRFEVNRTSHFKDRSLLKVTYFLCFFLFLIFFFLQTINKAKH